MKIAVIPTDGSPMGVTEKDIYGENGRSGVGGAELAIMTLMRMWTERGDDVIFFNDPKHAGQSCFEQSPRKAYNRKDPYDVHIAFRTPVYEIHRVKSGKRVWFSTDQYTSIPFKGYANKVDATVCISDFHRKHFADTYRFTEANGYHNIHVIDIPIRAWEYEKYKTVEKDPNMAIYTSIPDRGLRELLSAWKGLRHANPKLEVYITSDYTLWGCGEARDKQYRTLASGREGIHYLGAIPRKELVDLQLKASWMFYPCTYDELFCIAIAEAQVAGVHVVSTPQGACETTNMCDFTDIRGFVPACKKALSKKPKHDTIRMKALERFSPEAVLKQWDELIFN